MPEIVWKNPAGQNAGPIAKPLHLTPYLSSGKAVSFIGKKDLSRRNVLFLSIFFQFPAKLPREQDRTDFSFQSNLRPSYADCFHSDVAKLAYSDSGSTDGLHQQFEPDIAAGFSSLQQPFIIVPPQISCGIAENAALNPQKPDPAFVSADEVKKNGSAQITWS